MSSYAPIKDAKITVIDSLNVCLGESILVLKGYDMRENEAGYEEVVSSLETLIMLVLVL